MGPTISFELYPPRTPGGLEKVRESVLRLAAAGPEFIAVTYGAGGSTGGPSLDLLRWIRENTIAPPLAHLTCVGNGYEQTRALIREFLDAGVDRFLAVRGDPPRGASEGDDFLGDLKTSAELVQLIHAVRAEHAPYRETPLSGGDAVRVDPRPRARVAVAAFPNGHPRSRHRTEHLDALVAKQAAGAEFAITQLFFHADDYLRFVDQARAAGVTIPILPGIAPADSPRRLARMLELTGEPRPADLAVELEVEPTAEGRREIGIAHAAQLARAAIAGGAPGVHLYAFNQHDTVLRVLAEAGIRSHSTSKEPTA